MYAHEREFGVAVGADRVCRLWRWTIDDLASSISCCSLRKARRAAYTVAYSLSLSPTSPGRTRAAARSVIAGCPECSASLSIFLLLCLPDAVSMEIKLSARRQLISVGVMERPGATSSGSSACCRARLRRRLARGDKLRTGSENSYYDFTTNDIYPTTVVYP